MTHGTSHAQVSYLGHHSRVEENVASGEVAVDYGWRSMVQICETARYIADDGTLQVEGYVRLYWHCEDGFFLSFFPG